MPTSKGTLHVHIRWMVRRDMPEVLNIEHHSFGSPWSEDDFLKWHRNRNAISMVAELGEAVVGYMFYLLHESSLELVNMAVHEDYRGRSIGRQLVEKLQSKLSSHRRTKIDLTVNEYNLRAQLFFKGNGFTATRVVRNFDESTARDAFEMVHHVRPVVTFQGSEATTTQKGGCHDAR